VFAARSQQVRQQVARVVDGVVNADVVVIADVLVVADEGRNRQRQRLRPVNVDVTWSMPDRF
jgi:hypothetical protein